MVSQDNALPIKRLTLPLPEAYSTLFWCRARQVVLHREVSRVRRLHIGHDLIRVASRDVERRREPVHFKAHVHLEVQRVLLCLLLLLTL